MLVNCFFYRRKKRGIYSEGRNGKKGTVATKFYYFPFDFDSNYENFMIENVFTLVKF